MPNNQSVLVSSRRSLAQSVQGEKYPYDNTPITSFISKHGGDWRDWRYILRLNKVGSIFDLQEGQGLMIPEYVKPFATHPNA